MKLFERDHKHEFKVSEEEFLLDKFTAQVKGWDVSDLMREMRDFWHKHNHDDIMTSYTRKKTCMQHVRSMFTGNAKPDSLQTKKFPELLSEKEA